jgi:hypothetical protein
MITFDIETRSLPEPHLRQMYCEPTFEEFSASCDQRWKPDTVHAKYEEAKAGGWSRFLDKAALSAVTAEVLAIGYFRLETMRFVMDWQEDGRKEECQLIAQFWHQWEKARDAGERFTGVNIVEFDLPFLRQRSFILGVSIPEDAFSGRYWHRSFVDLADEWRSGKKFGQESASFETLARAFGTEGKQGESGKDFAVCWEADRERAIEYLRNDVFQPAIWAERMGLA